MKVERHSEKLLVKLTKESAGLRSEVDAKHKCGKQQEANYREFSPIHAVTYVALSKK